MRFASLLPLFTALLGLTQVTAEKNKFYYMESLCKNHFLQQFNRKLDGGVIWSKNERNLDCTVTFQTHSILQRFMLHFDMLQLDCNDNLLVFDGAHPGQTPKVSLSCRNTEKSTGAIFTRGNYVTLKYTTDNWGTDSNGFKLVITAVKDPKHGCKEFRCGQQEFCISADLICDGVDHCNDGTDEENATLCYSDESTSLFGLESTWVVMAIACALLTTIAIIVGAYLICRKSNLSTHRDHLQMERMLESNGTRGKGQTSECDTVEKLTRLPGNWQNPVGPRGYSARQGLRTRA